MQNGKFHVLVIEPEAMGDESFSAALQALDAFAVIDTVDNAGQSIEKLFQQNYDCALFAVGSNPRLAVDLRKRLDRYSIAVPVVAIADDLSTTDMINLLRHDLADCMTSAEINPDRIIRTIWNASRAAQAARALSEAESASRHRQMHDPLTDLPNRALFFDRLSHSIILAERQNQPVAVLTINVNHFSKVNADLGVEAGDELLRQLAGRLSTVTRRADTMARIGDDEFAIILQTGATISGSVTLAKKIVEVVSEPFDISGSVFTIATRIGMSLHPDHGHNPAELLGRAESAMKGLKNSGMQYAIYEPPENQEIQKTLSLSHDLRHAIQADDGQLALHFQPKIDFGSERVTGVEALLRWKHTKRGMVFPDIFIPIAEETGLIDELTDWVLNSALETLAEWRKEGKEISVAVNLSATSLHQADFAESIGVKLTRWGVPAEALVLEITESAIIQDVQRATETLITLDQMGIGISIDDFGTGYSSLSYIRKLPVKELKVDKSFVMSMAKSPDDWVIVSSLIELGHNLGLVVVAEGVEDTITWQLLQELGCDIGQGFYMSRPIAVNDFNEWLEQSPWGLAKQKSGATIEQLPGLKQGGSAA